MSDRDTLSAALIERDQAKLRLASLRRAAQLGDYDWAEIDRAAARYRAAEAAIDTAVGAIWVPQLAQPSQHIGSIAA